MIESIEYAFTMQKVFLSGLKIWKGATVIKYGAQHCRHGALALDLGAKYVVSVEGRPENLAKAPTNYGARLHTVCQDIRKLPFLGTFDIGMIFGVLYHLDDPVSFLKTQLPFIRQSVLIWTHYSENPFQAFKGYHGEFWNDPGVTNSDALEPLKAFWFARDELLRLLEEEGFTIKQAMEMPTPVSPHYKGMMIYAERMGG